MMITIDGCLGGEPYVRDEAALSTLHAVQRGRWRCRFACFGWSRGLSSPSHFSPPSSAHPSLPASLLYTSLARSAQCGPPISPAAMSPPMIIEGKQHRCGNDFEPELLHAPILLLRPKKLVARCRRCITTWIG